jgi:Protein of unknown function (DUF992)
MRLTFMTAIAVSCSLLSQAVAQKADVEIGVLTCTLEELSNAAGANGSAENQVRDAFCTFKPKSGSEESYGGAVRGLSLSQDTKTTVIWVVKADTVMPLVPGLLQQSYTLDPATPVDQLGPLVGETNSRIILQSMTDKREGSTNAAQKPSTTGYVVTGLQLKLKTTSG